MKNDLYHQAILDAKAVRAGAIANAKAMLQEAFEPKIQEMLRLKLSEELEDNMEEGDEHYEDSYMSEEAREGVYQDFAEWKKSFPEGTKFENKGGYVMAMDDSGKELGKWNPIQKTGMHADDFQYNNLEEDGTISEADLDEILSELEGLEEADEETMEEAKDGLHEGEEHMDEAEDEEGEDEEAEEEPAEEEVGDETKVVDITLGDLKDVLASYMAGQTSDEEGMDDMAAGDAGGGDDLSLDEILAELEQEGLEEEKDHVEEGEEHIEEAKGQVPGYGNVGGKGTTGYDEKVGGKGRTGYDAGSKKLHEATKTIEILSEKLKEINLLNAKLLYMNKIFKAKNLNESQKVSVVKSFDKATSVKEVKTVYEILSESISNKEKAPLKESRMQGFASKPAGMAPKKPIVDSDPTVDRWQKLVFGNK